MMDLFVSIANGFKPLTNVTKVLSWMSNKVVNVPLVFLALSKNKFWKSTYYNFGKSNTKKLKLCFL